MSVLCLPKKRQAGNGIPLKFAASALRTPKFAFFWRKVFDDQWNKEKEAIERILKPKFPAIFTQNQSIKGGIVFTHPEMKLDGDNSSTAAYGNIAYWIMQIKQADQILFLSTQEIMRLADTVITQSIPLREYNNSQSAIPLASIVYEMTKKKIENFCYQHEI